MTTGERMKHRRKELGLSAEYVADKLGVSPSTIYRYENGDIEKQPGEILAPLAKILKTTPAYLMGWSEESDELVSLDDAGRARAQVVADIADMDAEELALLLRNIDKIKAARMDD